jgi:hypothetical protein
VFRKNPSKSRLRQVTLADFHALSEGLLSGTSTVISKRSSKVSSFIGAYEFLFLFNGVVYLYLHHILNLTLTPTLDIKRLLMIGSCLPYVFVFFRNRKKGSSSLFGLILFAKKENSRGTLKVLDRGSTVYEQY